MKKFFAQSPQHAELPLKLDFSATARTEAMQHDEDFVQELRKMKGNATCGQRPALDGLLTEQA